MALNHRLDRLEKSARTERGEGCTQCWPAPGQPLRLAVRYDEPPARRAEAMARGGLPEDFCTGCGRRIVYRLEFDQAG